MALSWAQNVFTLWAKSVLVPSRLTAGIQKKTFASKIYGSQVTALVTLKEVIEDIMKKIKFFEYSIVLTKDVTKTI